MLCDLKEEAGLRRAAEKTNFEPRNAGQLVVVKATASHKRRLLHGNVGRSVLIIVGLELGVVQLSCLGLGRKRCRPQAKGWRCEE